MDKAIRNKKIVFALLTILFFLLIFFLNRMYPLYVDDWIYSMIYKDYHLNYDESIKRIDGLIDIFISQYNHYFAWGGRSIVHAIAQFLLLIDPFVRTFLNTLAFVFFLWLIYRMCNVANKKETQIVLYTGLFLMLFIFLPTFTQTVIWITGSANYLWGALILLSFVYFYYKHYMTGIVPAGRLFPVLFLLWGIFAGWTNENSVASVLIVLLFYLLYLKKKKVKIPLWMTLGFIGFCIGAAFMVLAPGNFIRANLSSEHTDTSFLWIVKQRIKNLLFIYRTVYGIPILSIVFLLLTFYLRKKSKDLYQSKAWRSAAVFFLAAHLAIAVMLFLPYFPARAAFFSTTALILSVSILWGSFDFDNIKIINAIIIAPLIILSVGIYFFRYTHIRDFNKRMTERIIFIEKEKKKGNFDIILHDRIYFPKEFDLYDASPDSSNWVNKTYLNYFGIRSLILID